MIETLILGLLGITVPPLLTGLLLAKFGMMAGYIILSVGTCLVLGLGVAMMDARTASVPLDPAYNIPVQIHGFGGFRPAATFVVVIVPSAVFTLIAVLVGRAAHARSEPDV